MENGKVSVEDTSHLNVDTGELDDGDLLVKKEIKLEPLQCESNDPPLCNPIYFCAIKSEFMLPEDDDYFDEDDTIVKEETNQMKREWYNYEDLYNRDMEIPVTDVRHDGEQVFAKSSSNSEAIQNSDDNESSMADYSFVRSEGLKDKGPSLAHSQSKVKSFTCDICRKSFKRKNCLARHIMSIHSGEKPFHCDLCTKSFTRNSQLKVHMVSHSGERPFHCDLCTKSFREKSCLIQHRRIHSGEKPFHCDICRTSFARKSGLVRHMRIHSGEKPFHCDLCTKSFREKSFLIQHRRIHSCTYCNRFFRMKSTVKRHKRIHSLNTL